jgi:LacI family transcriptional regulator
MRQRRPTISDVARAAGVSKATVSAVLNDSDAVGDDTRERVVASIERLNYRASQFVSRAERRDRCIALVIKEHDNPYYGGIIDGVRAGVEAEGYTLFVFSSGGDSAAERRGIECLRMHDVDGLIITPALGSDADLSHYFELKRRHIPFVLLEEIRGIPASLVDIENRDASRRATEYLIALGHTRIAHLAGPRYSSHSEERADGFRLAFGSAHVALRDDDVVPAGAHLDDGYRATLALLGAREAADRPTAVTCYNDLVALGACRAIRQLGLRIPDDVSVIGFDDIPMCDYLDVPLTSVRVPTFDMGERAARLLVRQLAAEESVAPEKVFLEGVLVRRASTGPRQPGDTSPIDGRERAPPTARPHHPHDDSTPPFASPA